MNLNKIITAYRRALEADMEAAHQEQIARATRERTHKLLTMARDELRAAEQEMREEKFIAVTN